MGAGRGSVARGPFWAGLGGHPEPPPQRFREGGPGLQSGEGRPGGVLRLGAPPGPGFWLPWAGGLLPPPQSGTNTWESRTTTPATAGEVLETVTSGPSRHLSVLHAPLPGLSWGTCWPHPLRAQQPRRAPLLGTRSPRNSRSTPSASWEQAARSEGGGGAHKAPSDHGQQARPPAGPAKGHACPHPPTLTATLGRGGLPPALFLRPECRATEGGRGLPWATQAPQVGGQDANSRTASPESTPTLAPRT